MRLLGLQIERLAHVGLGLAPLFGALLADAAIIVINPVGLFIGLRQCIDALRVGRDAVGELLAAPLDIAERHDGFDILGIFRRDGLQDLDGFIAALGGVEVGRELNLRVAPMPYSASAAPVCGESTSGDSFLPALVSRRPSNTSGCRGSFLSNAS